MCSLVTDVSHSLTASTAPLNACPLTALSCFFCLAAVFSPCLDGLNESPEEANRTYDAVIRSEMFGHDAFAEPEYRVPERNPFTSPVRQGPVHHKDTLVPRVPRNRFPDAEDLTSCTNRILNFGMPTNPMTLDVTRPTLPRADLPFNDTTLSILKAPRRKPRHVTRIPYKVLDAPDLTVCFSFFLDC